MKWKYLNLSLSFLSGLLISFLISSSHAQTTMISTSSPDYAQPILSDTQILQNNIDSNQDIILRRLQNIEDKIFKYCAK